MAVLLLVAVALALALLTVLSVAVIRLLDADNPGVGVCPCALGHDDGPLRRRTNDDDGLLPRRHVFSRLQEPAKAIRGTYFKRVKLGFQCGEPYLVPVFQGLAGATCPSADDDWRPAGDGIGPLLGLLHITALVGHRSIAALVRRRSIAVFLVAPAALRRPIARCSIGTPVSRLTIVTGDAVPVSVEGVGVTRCSGVVKETLQRPLGVRGVTEVVAADEGSSAEAVLALTGHAVVVVIEAERIRRVGREGRLGITLRAEVHAGGGRPFPTTP